MKLFGINIKLGSQGKASGAAPLELESKSLTPGAEAWLQGEDLDTGGAILSNAYQQVPWVYRAVNVLAEQVANVPFRFSVGVAGGENLITDGPLVDFYSRPHPRMNRFQYWELRVLWLMLRGECFRVPLYEENGTGSRNRKLKRILMPDPAHFQHLIEDHELIGWRYTGFGSDTPLASQVFLPEEIWFERLPNPFDAWRGLPPLHAANLAIRTDYASAALMKGLIENNGEAGTTISITENLTPTQQEQMLAALKQRKRRAGTADRPLVLWGGAQLVQPELTSSDLQFLENRKFLRSEICAAFGVPEEIVCTTDNAKYDVMAGARLNFIENRVAPLCRRLEAEEEATVQMLDPRAVGWFDLDGLPILQQARRSRLATAKAGFDMGVPLNELNRVLDLGFKRLPWGDTGYLPATLQKVGEDRTP